MITSLTSQKTIGSQKELEIGAGSFTFGTEYARVARMVALTSRSGIVDVPVTGRRMKSTLMNSVLCELATAGGYTWVSRRIQIAGVQLGLHARRAQVFQSGRHLCGAGL